MVRMFSKLVECHQVGSQLVHGSPLLVNRIQFPINDIGCRFLKLVLGLDWNDRAMGAECIYFLCMNEGN